MGARINVAGRCQYVPKGLSYICGTGRDSLNFKRPDDLASVSCTTHLAVPAGALPAAGFDVTVTRNCKSQRPDSVTLGVWIGTTTPLPAGGPYDYVRLQDAVLPGGVLVEPGMVFECSVTTPEDFMNAFGGWGEWNWTQLVIPGRKRKRDGIWTEIGMTYPPPTHSIYGLQCLDTVYPYNHPRTFYANGVKDWESDTPGQPLEADDPLVTAWDVLDSFDCWLMYLPPGDGSVAVPLKKVDWYWEFDATKSSGAWTVSGTAAQWSPGADYPPHPEWTFAVDANYITYDY